MHIHNCKFNQLFVSVNSIRMDKSIERTIDDVTPESLQILVIELYSPPYALSENKNISSQRIICRLMHTQKMYRTQRPAEQCNGTVRLVGTRWLVPSAFPAIPHRWSRLIAVTINELISTHSSLTALNRQFSRNYFYLEVWSCSLSYRLRSVIASWWLLSPFLTNRLHFFTTKPLIGVFYRWALS